MMPKAGGWSALTLQGSSFLHDWTGAKGTFETESQWTALKRQRMGLRLPSHRGPVQHFPPERS